MGSRKKRAGHDVRPGDRAKELHKRRLRGQALGVPGAAVLNARPEMPSLKSKHRSYYEIVENKDKKKKLEFKITDKKSPPPGFEFVPIGNPDLTTACKELSREQDAMIFIVSSRTDAASLAQQTNRIGHHIRQTIVEEARRLVSDSGESSDDQPAPGVPEPIPESQEEINDQADKAIRDLFPRIPNTDRRLVIEHSFKKGATKKGEPLVGLAQDIPLSRRVQLAVLAHIRHTHTRYDKLLRETTYINARKAVEQLCLDILVKWRGDEETGRDQLDEILREVIVISDSEGEDGGDGDDDAATDSSDVESGDLAEPRSRPRHALRAGAGAEAGAGVPPAYAALQHSRAHGPQPAYRQVHVPVFDPQASFYASAYAREAPTVKRARRGFKRYEAALAARWDEARDRVRLQVGEPLEPPLSSAGHQPHAAPEPLYEEPRPPPAIFHHHDVAQTTPYESEAYVSRLHPVEQPVQGPVAGLSESLHQRSVSDGLPRGHGSYGGPRRNTPTRGMLVHADDARDYLVPSVEPMSPFAGAQPFSAGPVFVRTVSPRQPSHPPRDFREDVSRPHGRRPSPGWGGDGPAPMKRMRTLDGRPLSRPEPAAFHHQPMHDERRPPVYFYAGGAEGEAAKRVRSPPPAAPPLVGAPVRAPVRPPEMHAFERQRTEPPVPETWAGRPSPLVVSHDYREAVRPERRDPTRLIEIAEDVRHPQVRQHRHSTPVFYDLARAHVQYEPLADDRAPPGPSFQPEPPRTYEYGYHVPYVEEPHPPPAAYEPAAHAEPAPMFIRHVERPNRHYVAVEQGHPRQRHGEEAAMHGFQPPPHVSEPWGQPYDQVVIPLRDAPMDGPGAYPVHPADWQHPFGGSVHHGYPDHRGLPYDPNGP